MRPFRHSLVIATLVAHLVGNLVGGYLAAETEASWLWTGVSGLYVAQFGLFCIWGTLGTGSWFRRFPRTTFARATLFAASGVGLLLLLNCSPMVQWLFLVASAIVAVPAGAGALLRRAGFRLLLFADEPAPRGAAFQISIRGLLAVTILVAVLFSLGHNLPEPVLFRVPPPSMNLAENDSGLLRQRILVVSTGLALFVGGISLSIWACFSLGEVWSRLAVGAAACISLALLIAYYLHGSPLLYVRNGFFAAVLFGVVSATLLVFRHFGYRLSRMEVLTPAEAEESAMSC